MARLLGLIFLLAVLSACGAQEVDDSRVADLGEFRLGHNIVIATKMQMVPGSREASQEEWVESLTQAFADRFERYEGNQLYHFGISVEGYMLAPPGIPLVAAPKSAVVLNITIWKDAEARKLNEKPHQLLIFESFDQGPFVGSGYTSTREEQLANLAFNASRELERWLEDQQADLGWFDFDADAVIETDEEDGANSDDASEDAVASVGDDNAEQTDPDTARSPQGSVEPNTSEAVDPSVSDPGVLKPVVPVSRPASGA